MLRSKLPKNARLFIRLIDTLSDRDKNILIDRFIGNLSLRDTADKYHISRTRVEQIENKIIKDIDNLFNFINV